MNLCSVFYMVLERKNLFDSVMKLHYSSSLKLKYRLFIVNKTASFGAVCEHEFYYIEIILYPVNEEVSL